MSDTETHMFTEEEINLDEEPYYSSASSSPSYSSSSQSSPPSPSIENEQHVHNHDTDTASFLEGDNEEPILEVKDIEEVKTVEETQEVKEEQVNKPHEHNDDTASFVPIVTTSETIAEDNYEDYEDPYFNWQPAPAMEIDTVKVAKYVLAGVGSMVILYYAVKKMRQ